MNYILLMTSAGSLMFVGQLLLEKLMGKHMSQTCRYRMLVIAMFTYLVPWVWMKGLYEFIKLPFPAGKEFIPAVSGSLIVNDAVIRATDELVVTSDYSFKLNFMFVWTSVAILVMLVRCGVYFYTRHALLKCARHCEQDVPEELLRRLKQEFGIKRRIKIIRVSGKRRSLTIGALRPVVFLQKDCREDELENILRHEFIHIVRGDFLIKMLMQLVCCVHWFNPFVYWLNHRMDRICEKACDERVVRDMAEDEREAYARLIIKSMKASEKKSKGKVLFGSFFASNKKFAEERVRVIMDKRKSRLWEKIVVAAAFAALVFADSLTALAYPQVYNMNADSTQKMNDLAKGVGMLKTDVNSVEHYRETWNRPMLYDEQIVTADGEILPAPEQGQTKVLCFHKWQDAEYDNHIKEDDGSCIVQIYECTYCPRCHTINIGDLIQTITFNPCNHNL